MPLVLDDFNRPTLSPIVRLQQRRKQTVTHGYTSHRGLQQGPGILLDRIYGRLSKVSLPQATVAFPSLLSLVPSKPAHSLKPVRVMLTVRSWHVVSVLSAVWPKVFTQASFARRSSRH